MHLFIIILTLFAVSFWSQTSFGISLTCSSNSQCNDGNPCTTDKCTNFRCVNSPKNCDDNNPCTSDSCVRFTGACSYSNAPFGTLCDDGLKETTHDHCFNGECVVCGDNLLEGDETCDNGRQCYSKGPNCTTSSNCGKLLICSPKGNDGCDADCEPAENPSLCGDGVICNHPECQPIEGCDDGNSISGDGCSNTCRFEVVCGDGKIGGSEECDPGSPGIPPSAAACDSGARCSEDCECEPN